MGSDAPSRLVVGCGYLGFRVAQRWLRQGEPVAALTRSADRAGQLAAAGLRPIVGDVTRPESLAALQRLSTVHSVLLAVGYDRSAGYRSIHQVYVDGLRHVVGALPVTVHKLIYVSSTGVYGQSDGQWVDETSPAEPLREGGRACLEAERVLADAPHPSRLILRLAGIYGPGRLPRWADVRQGRPLEVSEQALLNLIHVDDAVQAVLAADRQPAPGVRRWNVADGHPVTRGDFYRRLSELAGLAPPQFGSGSRPPPDAGQKRVSNQRMLDELGVRLAFPSYREGLAAWARTRQLEGPAGDRLQS